MPELLTATEAVALIPDNATVLVNPLPIEKINGEELLLDKSFTADVGQMAPALFHESARISAAGV